MDPLIHADIFFFISTIALVIITIGLSIAMVYLIKILRTVSQVTEKLKDESEELIKDVKALRGSIKTQGFRLLYVKDFIQMIFGKRKSKKD